MSSCHEVYDALLDYAEGTLEPKMRDGFEAHVRSCELCQRLADEYWRAATISRALFRGAPPAQGVETLLAFLRARHLGGEASSKLQETAQRQSQLV